MSLDNVLAVAGAARDHWQVLVFGLALSVLLMGVAATLIARLLHKHRWIAYVGLLIILYVAAAHDVGWRLADPRLQPRLVRRNGARRALQDRSPARRFALKPLPRRPRWKGAGARGPLTRGPLRRQFFATAPFERR